MRHWARGAPPRARRRSSTLAVERSPGSRRPSGPATAIELHGKGLRRRRWCCSTDAGATRDSIARHRMPSSRPAARALARAYSQSRREGGSQGSMPVVPHRRSRSACDDTVTRGRVAGSETAVDGHLPRRSDVVCDVRGETVLANDPLDRVDRMDGGTQLLPEQPQHEVHGADDEPHEARVAWIDKTVKALARAAESPSNRSQSGYTLITRSSVTMSAAGADSASWTKSPCRCATPPGGRDVHTLRAPHRDARRMVRRSSRRSRRRRSARPGWRRSRPRCRGASHTPSALSASMNARVEGMGPFSRYLRRSEPARFSS